MDPWKDVDGALIWTIEMRYYTAIDQAVPTDAGQLSNEFTLTIVEKLYDPCNSNTLSELTQADDISYAWS
jgi:hypothetical protein